MQRKDKQLQKMIGQVEDIMLSLRSHSSQPLLDLAATREAATDPTAREAVVVTAGAEELQRLRQLVRQQAAELVALKSGESAQVAALELAHRDELDKLRVHQAAERQQAEAKLRQLEQNFLRAKQRSLTPCPYPSLRALLT